MSLCGFAFQAPLPCPLDISDIRSLMDISDSQQECLIQYQQQCGNYFPYTKASAPGQTFHCALGSALVILFIGWIVQYYAAIWKTTGPRKIMTPTERWNSAVKNGYYAISGTMWALIGLFTFINICLWSPANAIEHLVQNQNRIWLIIFGFILYALICSICDFAFDHYYKQNEYMQYRSFITLIRYICIVSHCISLVYGISIYVYLSNTWSAITFIGSWLLIWLYLYVYITRTSKLQIYTTWFKFSSFIRGISAIVFLTLNILYDPSEDSYLTFFYTNDRYDSNGIFLSIILLIHFVLFMVIFIFMLIDQWIIFGYSKPETSKKYQHYSANHISQSDEQSRLLHEQYESHFRDSNIY